LNSRIDAAQIKYPANSTFASIKSQAPVALDCSQSFSSGFASKIENLKNSTTSLESDVQNELARLLRIENLAKAPAKITITCKKGKLTKKVTASKPVCPSGYKKA
jgi:hypothetical protein